jgi:hypothetical protein
MDKAGNYQIKIEKLPKPFSSGITADTPADSRCQCVWAYLVDKKVFGLKYVNRLCPLPHNRLDALPEAAQRDLMALLGGLGRIRLTAG